LHKEDARSKKIIFVSNCILNANNKVLEFARYPGVFREVLDLLVSYDLGVMQMPCPEVLYMGNQRWWTSRNLYDNVGYRRFCRELASREIDYMENYHRIGYSVTAVLSCDGSPTCGVTLSSYCENWGGRPKEIPRTLVEKPGVYIEEMTDEFTARGLNAPPFLGLCMDDRDKTNSQCLDELESSLALLMGKHISAKEE
jgi:predicted secreted protein